MINSFVIIVDKSIIFVFYLKSKENIFVIENQFISKELFPSHFDIVNGMSSKRKLMFRKNANENLKGICL
jgi:hypothetical protein